MKAAVLGATGYTGQLLLRILKEHPEIDQILPVSTSKDGIDLSKALPRIGKGLSDKLTITQGKFITQNQAVKEQPQVVFSALPHLKSAPFLEPFLKDSVVVDLSADYRIASPEVFEKAYGTQVPDPQRLDQAAYGLCEWNSSQIKESNLIASPGCYPTATLLPLLPFVEQQFNGGPIFVNAQSGISGAGKKLIENLLFVERDENAGAYNPGKSHRHSYEMQYHLDKTASESNVFFTPHLVPMKKGMTVTTVFELAKDLKEEQAFALLSEKYKSCPFVNIREDLPQTADVAGSNRIDISLKITDGVLYLFSAIDNLMKGASGQAVQSMNLRFGFDETAGLPLLAEV